MCSHRKGDGPTLGRRRGKSCCEAFWGAWRWTKSQLHLRKRTRPHAEELGQVGTVRVLQRAAHQRRRMEPTTEKRKTGETWYKECTWQWRSRTSGTWKTLWGACVTMAGSRETRSSHSYRSAWAFAAGVEKSVSDWSSFSLGVKSRQEGVGAEGTWATIPIQEKKCWVAWTRRCCKTMASWCPKSEKCMLVMRNGVQWAGFLSESVSGTFGAKEHAFPRRRSQIVRILRSS